MLYWSRSQFFSSSQNVVQLKYSLLIFTRDPLLIGTSPRVLTVLMKVSVTGSNCCEMAIVILEVDTPTITVRPGFTIVIYTTCSNLALALRTSFQVPPEKLIELITRMALLIPVPAMTRPLPSDVSAYP